MVLLPQVLSSFSVLIVFTKKQGRNGSSMGHNYESHSDTCSDTCSDMGMEDSKLIMVETKET